MNRRHPSRSLLALVLLLLVALPGCSKKASSATSLGLTSPVKVAKGNISDVVEVSGQVVALNSKTLTFGTVGGRVTEVKVHAGQEVKKGDTLVLIDPAAQERTLREAQADLKTAEAVLADAQNAASAADLASAQAALHTAQAAKAAADVDLAAAQAAGIQTLQEAADDAQAALLDAQDNLKQTDLSNNQTTIRDLEYDQAYFERALRDLKEGQDSTDLQKSLDTTVRQLATARAAREAALRSANDAVTKAKQTLADAQEALARARAGQQDPTTSARLALQKAVANVDKAQKALDEVKAGGDSDAVKNAKTAYDAAKARVTTAQTNLTNSTMVAPFDGVVFNVYVAVDQYVQANTNIVYLADARELRVNGQVTEMDVTKLQLDQAVRITFDALSGQTFAGKVLTIPATGTSSNGLTTYKIEMSLDKGKADIRTGMLANVRIIVGEKADVLTVPTAAVQYTTANKPFVVVQDAPGRTHDQTITTGINDGVLTEVLSGLTAGQTVLMPLTSPGTGVTSATAAPSNRTPSAQGTPQQGATPGAQGRPQTNGTPGAQGTPQMNGTPPANFAPPANWTPGAQGGPQFNGTPPANFTPPANWTPGARGGQGTPQANGTPGAQRTPQANRTRNAPTPTATPAASAQNAAASRG